MSTRRPLRIPTPALAAAALLLAAAAMAAPAADVVPEETATMVRIYTGPTFWTGDPDLPEAAAVAVGPDGVIVETYGVVPDDTTWEVVALPGKLALPGLHDAHLHVTGIGKHREQVSLEGATSIAEARDRAFAWATQHPDAAVILGRGWDQNDWPDAKYPTWRDLEGAPDDRPMVLRRVDGHATWVNKAMLDLAGIGAGTPDPEGGRILRDADGAPTGLLIDNAADLLDPVLPAPTADDRERWLLAGLNACADAGLVAVHDMGEPTVVCDIVQKLADENRLPIRLFVYLDGSDPTALDAMTRYRATDRFAVRGMKYYADGALGSRGALLLEDYSDEPGTRGLPVTEAGKLAGMVAEVHRRGFQCAIHAIGDGGNRVALDAIAAAEAQDPPGAPPRRHRIEHAQVVATADFQRFKTLGAVASMQPTHCTSDLRWAELRLGSERVLGAYAWRTFLDLGVPLAFGSDAPVEDWNPLPGIYAAITRQEPGGFPHGGWYPEQRLTWQEAVAAFTAGAAYAVGREQDLGVLHPGALFDCTVLDSDPRDRDPQAWLDAKPAAVLVGGKQVR